MNSTPTERVWGMTLSPNQRIVMLALAGYADPDGTHIYPDIRTVAWQVDLKVRQVRYIIASLVDSGALVITDPGGGRGKRTTYAIDYAAVPARPRLIEAPETVQSTPAETVQSMQSGLHSLARETVQTVQSRTAQFIEPETVQSEGENCAVHTYAQSDRGPKGPRDTNQSRVVPVSILDQKKVQAVQTELTRRELPALLSGQDKRSIIDSEADPELIVDAYEALLSDKWGDAWVRGNKSPGVAAARISIYLAWRQRGGSNPTMKGAEVADSRMTDTMEALLGRRPDHRSGVPQRQVPRLSGGVQDAVGKTWADEPF